MSSITVKYRYPLPLVSPTTRGQDIHETWSMKHLQSWAYLWRRQVDEGLQHHLCRIWVLYNAIWAIFNSSSIFVPDQWGAAADVGKVCHSPHWRYFDILHQQEHSNPSHKEGTDTAPQTSAPSNPFIVEVHGQGHPLPVVWRKSQAPHSGLLF